MSGAHAASDRLVPPTLAWLGWVTVGLVASKVFASAHWVDADLWGQMAQGRETLRLGWPPETDPFAYVPTLRPYVHHEWLSGVIFYLLVDRVGGASLKVLLVAIGLGTLTLAALTARRLGAPGSAITAVVLLALPSLAIGHALFRPQVFTFSLLALVLWLLVHGDTGQPGALVLIPPVTVLWANLHGGFLAGVGVVALFLLVRVVTGPPPWRLGLTLAAAVLGTLLNPYGIAYWRYLARAIPMPRPLIEEWAPLYAHPVSHWPQLTFVLVAALSAWVARRPYAPGLSVLAVTGLLALRHTKHIGLFAVAAVAFVPAHLSSLVERLGVAARRRRATSPPRATRLATIALAAVALVLVVDLTVMTPWHPAVPRTEYPVGAVEFLRRNQLRGNLATPFNWGEYVLWKLGPAVKVSLDGRYEAVYPAAVAEDTFRFERGQGDWRRLLRDYPTEMVLMPVKYPAAALMAREPGWSLVYEDGVAALFLPSDRSHRAWEMPEAAPGTLP